VGEAGFSLQALWALRDDRSLSPAEWKVAVALVSYCDEHGACHPGLRKVASTARTSVGAVRRALASLEKSVGPLLVRVERRRRTEGGERDSHRYQLTVVGCDQADPTCDQASPGCDQADPTCDQASPTVCSPEPQGRDQASPRGVITGVTKEDKRRGQGKKTVKSARPWRRVPADWAPNAEHERLAKDLRVDLPKQLAIFRDHEFRSPRSDPNAAFRTWIRKSVEFGGTQRRATGPVQRDHDGYQPFPETPARAAAE
jgi:hypothetical protein